MRARLGSAVKGFFAVVGAIGVVWFWIAAGPGNDESNAARAEATAAPTAAPTTAPTGNWANFGAEPSAAEPVADDVDKGCSEHTVDEISSDGRIIVLDDGTDLLVGDAFQSMIEGWDGETLTYCDGGRRHRYVVHDGDSIPVGLVNQ